MEKSTPRSIRKTTYCGHPIAKIEGIKKRTGIRQTDSSRKEGAQAGYEKKLAEG